MTILTIGHAGGCHLESASWSSGFKRISAAEFEVINGKVVVVRAHVVLHTVKECCRHRRVVSPLAMTVVV